MTNSNYIEIGGCKILTDLNEVWFDGNIIKLTPKEKDVLLLLHEHMGTTVSRSQILKMVWGNSSGNDSGLTQAVSKLRKVLKDDPKRPELIKTIPKMGYQLVTDIKHESVRKESFKLNDFIDVLELKISGRWVMLMIGIIAAILIIFNIQVRVQCLPL